MLNRFVCKECGSEDVALSRYARCMIPVVVKDGGTCEYLDPIIDSDDYIYEEDYFCCLNCKSQIGDCADPMQTENELLEYLNSDMDSQNDG